MRVTRCALWAGGSAAARATVARAAAGGARRARAQRRAPADSRADHEPTALRAHSEQELLHASDSRQTTEVSNAFS